MIQLNAIIVREIPQTHKYRWHVTTENYIITFKKVFINILCK